ncbi:hypothetical protein BD408DRAFT_425351 [Parasitella parasitica]|nr:hypothetical protein BD408DRAFT_425351 [Parasitella parasitica]
MSNNRWLNWIQEEAQENRKQRPLNRRAPSSPVTSSPTAAPTKPSFTPPPNTNLNANTRLISPSKEQLDVILPMPVQCFCGKKAFRTYTSEYGPVLVCSNFELDPATTLHKTQSKYVCGFHVHEISWTKFCDTLKATNLVSLDYVELRSCPLYNFTFCAIFRISNKFELNPPIVLPKCFCHSPVTMRISRANSAIIFACKNGDVDGAKKCSWVLPAHQVAFPRPNFHIHNCISHEEYMVKKHKTLTEKIASPQQPPTRSPGNHLAPPAEGHQADLLATLHSNNSNSLDTISETDVQLLKPTGSKPLIIPTCVMAKRPTSMPVLSRSSSASSCSNVTSPVMSSDPTVNPNTTSALNIEKNQQFFSLKFEMDKLTNENSQLKSAIDSLTTKFDSLASKADRLKVKTADLQTELHRNKNEHNEQNILRINCQERLSKIELDVVHLMNDNEKLKEEVLVMVEEKTKSGKDDELNKCRLCFTRNIEYCLLPCYHYAYCQLCAQKLTECAICRTEIFGIQKIYSC